MSDRNFPKSLRDRATQCPVYNVDVSGHNLTGGLHGQACGLLESLVVWRDPAQTAVVLTFDYEDGATCDLTHRWFRLSFGEARRLAAALLNATEAANERSAGRGLLPRTLQPL